MTALLPLTAFRRVLLALLALGFAAMLLAFVPSPASLWHLFDKPIRPEVKAPPPLKLAAVPPLATFDPITARPLFNTDRKPDPTPPPPKDAPGTPSSLGDLSQYKLVGMILSRNTQLALVRKTDGPVVTLKPQDTLDGWTVAKIEDNGISLTGGDRTEVLAIPKATNGASPAPTP